MQFQEGGGWRGKDVSFDVGIFLKEVCRFLVRQRQERREGRRVGLLCFFRFFIWFWFRVFLVLVCLVVICLQVLLGGISLVVGFMFRSEVRVVFVKFFASFIFQKVVLEWEVQRTQRIQRIWRGYNLWFGLYSVWLGFGVVRELGRVFG